MSKAMVFKLIFLGFYGACFGLMSSAGVFTVLVAVGLIPRFAGKTHTADKVFLYEESVLYGCMFGCLLSVFERYCNIAEYLRTTFPAYSIAWESIGIVVQGFFGLFCGMFIGCLALAIAEILDSIPIFARRISFRHGIGLAVLSMAAGKVCGAFIYFITEFCNFIE